MTQFFRVGFSGHTGSGKFLPGLVQDRLSALPEDILVQILSILPIQSAVVTAVLSSRWRRLWTKVNSINLILRQEPWLSWSYSCATMLAIVDKLLPQLSLPCIRSFVLHHEKYGCYFYKHCTNYINAKNLLLRQVCTQNVVELHIKDKIKCSCYGSGCVAWDDREIPLCIFQTQSLVVLELKHGNFGSIPVDVDVSLPNLKRLSIKLDCSCHRFLAKVIQSCTVLEDLCFHLDCYKSAEDFVIDLSCQNLRRLDMKFITWAPTTLVTVKILIKAPKLKHFLVRTSFYRFRSVDNVFALLKDQGITITIPSMISVDTNLLSELSGHFLAVKDIVLGNANVQSGAVTSPGTVFSNLTHLKLLMNSRRQLGDLMDLLLQVSALEVLVLQCISESDDESTGWALPDLSPTCLLTSIRHIEIEIPFFIDEMAWLNCVKYLLSSAQALEQLVFTINYWGQYKGGEVNLFKELKLFEELQKCSRSSSQCVIQFSGEHVSGTVGKSSNLQRRQRYIDPVITKWQRVL